MVRKLFRPCEWGNHELCAGPEAEKEEPGSGCSCSCHGGPSWTIVDRIVSKLRTEAELCLCRYHNGESPLQLDEECPFTVSLLAQESCRRIRDILAKVEAL